MLTDFTVFFLLAAVHAQLRSQWGEKLSLIICLKNRRYLSCKIRRWKETKRRRLKGEKYRKMTQTVAIEWEMSPSEKLKACFWLLMNPFQYHCLFIAGLRMSRCPLESIIRVFLLWRCQFNEWVCIIIVQHTQTNQADISSPILKFKQQQKKRERIKKKSQNVINDIMWIRGAWFRAVTESAQRHSLKYKRSSTRNERRSIAKCLAWDYETMRRQQNDRECLLGRS